MRVLVFLLFVSKAFSQDCTLNVTDSESPFIVTEALKFPTYADNETSIFTFATGDVFYVVCPGSTQSPFLGEHGSQVSCQNGTQLTGIEPTEGPMDFAEIKCKPWGLATVKTENETCATTGKLYQIGFDIDTLFLSLITVCFDTTKLIPIYSTYNHTVIANETEELSLPQLRDSENYELSLPQLRDSENYYDLYICNGTNCDWSDNGKLFSEVNIGLIYDSQGEIFTNLSVSNDSSLLRFPLAATNAWYINKDLNGQEIQVVPYYDYINVVAGWDIDGLDVLLYMLDTYIGSGVDIGPTVTVGTLGVATLPKSEGEEEVEMYLAQDKVPVPKWIWIDLDLKEQIIFFFNNPDTDKLGNQTDTMCSEHFHTTPGVFSCAYEAVIDADMSQILEELKGTSGR